MRDGAPITLSVIRCGSMAARLFGTHVEARVAAVFERSFYVEANRQFSNGQFVCVGGGTIGDGPIHAIVGDAALRQALARLQPGQAVSLSPRAHGRSATLDVSAASIWRPPPWPASRPVDTLSERLKAVRQFACEASPHDGLSRLVMGIGDLEAANTVLLHRIAVSRVEQLKMWLQQALSSDGTRAPPPVGLLGLGPGLTPSGDDVLGGMMIALDAIAEHGLRDRIAQAVLQAATSATSPLSTAFLAAAAEGQGSAALHDFIAAIISGAGDATVLATAKDLAAIGHTSGWDAMAGAMLGLEVRAPSLSK